MAVTLRGSGQTPVQIVQGTYSTETSTTSGSYVTTNLTATITPTNSSNRILVVTSMAIARAPNASNNSGLFMQLQRNGTGIVSLAGSYGYTNTNLWQRQSFAYNFLDNPATTSATTYSWAFLSQNAGDTVYANFNNTQSTILLMELAYA